MLESVIVYPVSPVFELITLIWWVEYNTRLRNMMDMSLKRLKLLRVSLPTSLLISVCTPTFLAAWNFVKKKYIV